MIVYLRSGVEIKPLDARSLGTYVFTSMIGQ
jgi:hypothetical protein